jgi:adenylate cyclase
MLFSKIFQRKLKKFLFYLLVSFSMYSVAVYMNIYNYDVVESFDKKLQDYMFKIRGPIKHDDNVLIVDIDEKSLNELGQWPWPRDKVAKILQNLTQAGTGVIGLDIVFAEKDQSSPAKVLKDLGKDYSDAPDFDELLNTTVKNTPTILGYQFMLNKMSYLEKDEIDIPAIIVERGNVEGKKLLTEAQGTVLNHQKLQESGYSSGFFNNIPDSSGVIRSVPMVIRYNDILYPSLALEVLRASSGINTIFVNYSELGIENIQIGDFKIPTDRHGNFMVNFRGPGHTFKYYSAADIYSGNFNAEDFDGKVVLVGTTAAGLFDLRAIPFDSVYPGVEVHANIIDNILSEDFLYLPNWIDGVNMLILLVVTFLTVMLVAYIPVWLKPIVVATNLVLIFYGGYYALFTHGIVIQTFLPIITVIASASAVMFFNYWFELKQQKMIKNKFAAKVSKDVMENLLQNQEGNIFAAMDKEVTVFFSDVRSFTNISESMPNAHTLIAFMNEYMDPMTDIIIDQKGTVDKFIGDAIMAYWNAPADVPDHADHAVIATLEQLHKLKSLNEKLSKDERFQNTVKMCKENNMPIIDIGIGINTGEVVVGEMGSSKRSDYTVIGDAVNLGSRLESLCKYYGSKCNISNFTKDRLKGKYIYRFLDLVTVKGKSEPVEIWQVIDYDREDAQTLYNISREELNHELDSYHEAIALYKNSDFKSALEIFERLDNLKNKTNKAIYNIYVKRCENYIQHPPKNFDGVFKHSTKG